MEHGTRPAFAQRRAEVLAGSTVDRDTWSTIDLCGDLIITETDRFARALLSGVGHGRAFGCGLLLVRRR